MRLILSLFLLALLSFPACSRDQKLEVPEGPRVAHLPAGQKLVSVQIDYGSLDKKLWYLTRPMRQDETPEIYEFQKENSFSSLDNDEFVIFEHKLP
jgi:hypothetical protein